MNKIAAISFDIDQTLIDFDKALKRSLNRVSEYISENFDCDVSPKDMQQERDLVASWPEYRAADLLTVRRAAFKFTLEKRSLPAAHSDALMALFIQERFKKAVFMPNAIELLSSLQQRPEIKVAALSNGNSDPRRFGFGVYFDVILLQDDLEFKKPDHRAFLKLQESLDISEPGSIIHVGDSIAHDVEGAKQAGLRSIWYNYEDVAVSDDKADHTVCDLIDVLDVLNSYK